MDYKEIGQKLRKRRKELGLTQENVAKKSDVSASFYSHIESGSGKVGLMALHRISKTLLLSIDGIFNESQPFEYSNFDTFTLRIYVFTNAIDALSLFESEFSELN